VTSNRRLALGCALTVFRLFLAVSSTGQCATIPLADTARFLAGKGVASDSKLAAHAQAPSYVDYAAQIGAGWTRFQQPNLERMRAWWTSYAPAKYSTVLYPFSGPDIANALAFFPDADSYLMFGLEPPGAIPDLQAMPEEEINAGLNGLKASLNNIFKVNFFLTKGMEKKLDKGPFSSITGLLLFFLAMNDCEVTGARRVAVGPGATLEPGTAADDSINWRTSPPRSRIPGVEITFTRAGGKEQTVRYFMVNISDDALAKSSPDFLPYLASRGRLVTMIKSASYLMHKDSPRDPARFEQIRALVLSQSDFVVQDDSGVPLRLFARDQWKLLFHGSYDAPIPQFQRRAQKDLKLEMQRNSTGKLPFSYGYDYKQGESNLMTAQRLP
jgi:hypothetical protein